MYMCVCVWTYSERCDDKPGGGAQVLIAVHIGGIGHPHYAVIYAHIPVVTDILHPLKVLGTRNLKEELFSQPAKIVITHTTTTSNFGEDCALFFRHVHTVDYSYAQKSV